MFKKLCLIGVGLIGGSIARSARQHGLCHTIVGYGREQEWENLQAALELGVIDQGFHSIADAVQGADCVVIATPVGAIESILTLLKPHWQPNTLYTDVGSTKVNVINAAQKVFGSIPENLVPGHPIAGAEESGVGASVAALFLNKRVILTPEASTKAEAIATLTEFWQQLGAQVESMSAQHHDTVFAATSHLPHIAAFALVNMLGQKDEQSEIFKYAASGFKDFTRIASSDPNMWLDICMANKAEIMPLLKELQNEFCKIQQMLENNQQQELINTFNYARQARQRFLDIFEN